MTAPVPGTLLAGKYRVDRVLGEGGMGIVVAATDEQLERKVAIKFLLPEYVLHKEAATRFLREARSAVKIQSEHVARVIDVGTMDTGAPYMVMEYLEGQDLSGVLTDRGFLPVEEAVGHVLEACDAIAEAHSVGIVHRDLKPANLFLARQPDGSTRVKVLDFGISKATMTGGATDPSLTRTSSMMGSPLYMSPEQMKSAKNVDPRTDIWALGIILYELLHGEPPFYAESIPELSAKVLLEEPLSIRAKRSEIPEALEAIVLKALAKNPDQRYPTVADFAIALNHYGPARTRANVERASRVLRVTGGIGVAPVSVPSSVVAPVSAVAAAAPQGAYAQTAAAWAETGPTPKKKSKGPLFAAIGGGVLVLGALVAVVATRGGESAAGPEAAPKSGPAAQAVPAEAPVPAPARPPEPAIAPAVVAEATAAAEPATPPSAAAVPVVPVAPVPVAGRPGHAVPRGKPQPSAKPAAAPTPAAPAASPDPFSGFGSRK